MTSGFLPFALRACGCAAVSNPLLRISRTCVLILPSRLLLLHQAWLGRQDDFALPALRPSGQRLRRCFRSAPADRSNLRSHPADQTCHSFDLAGAAGFEPANAGIKTRCLTTWRRPNIRADPGFLPGLHANGHGKAAPRLSHCPLACQSRRQVIKGDSFTPHAAMPRIPAGTSLTIRRAASSLFTAVKMQPPEPLSRA